VKIRSPQQKTCVLCGRVGTRVFKQGPRGGDVCTNTKACVTRLCDKVFLDPLKPIEAPWVFLGTLAESVKFYGVIDDVPVRSIKATIEITAPFSDIIEGGKLHALG
jgi:hypothetical protein